MKTEIKFALSGVIIGVICMLLFYSITEFNIFNLPKYIEGEMMQDYEAPFGYSFSMFAIKFLSPGQFIHIFTTGIRGPIIIIFWLIGIALNFPIYYFYGLIFVKIKRAICC